MHDIIIIGAGVSGISAGIYASSRSDKVLILESQQIGGLISHVSTVTHYLGALPNETGAEFAKRLAKQAEQYKLQIKYEKVCQVKLAGSIKEVKTDKAVYQAKQVIIANGSHAKNLQIEGQEALMGTAYGLNAVKSAPNFRDKCVFVLGAGDGAIKEAIYLASLVKEVVVLNVNAKLTCVAEFKHKLAALENVQVWSNVRLQKLYGQAKLEAFDLLHTDSGELEHVSALGSGIFTYVGTSPNTEIYTELELKDGYIPVDSDMQTKLKGVFAVGDIRVKSVRQIATAVNDGTLAAIKACAQF